MLINSNQPRGRQHFTIAHELYHLFIEEKAYTAQMQPRIQQELCRTKCRHVCFIINA